MNKPAPKVVVRKAPGKPMPNDNDADDQQPAAGRSAILARLQERAKK